MAVNEIQIQKEVIEIINDGLLEESSLATFTKNLENYISDLINNDFQKLVLILYKVDVDEHELKNLLPLKENENTAALIAELIITRQLKKIETRKQFNSTTPSAEEKW
ncbi:MAG: hypothetical protein H0W12_04150 [Chitinophagaceae bacterium]|nr:hypothetical protein [Chitinophagaceae bacterium]